MAAAISSVFSYETPHEASLCMVEFKNELCDITSMPMVELTGYVAHLQSQAMLRDRYAGSHVPCLGLTVVGKLNISDLQTSLTWVYIISGPYITFYAIIFLGQWRVVSLTPTLSCIASASDGGDRKTLFAAFSAALDLLDRIDEGAERIISAPSTSEGLDYKLPYISALPGRGSRSNEEINILDSCPPSRHTR